MIARIEMKNVFAALLCTLALATPSGAACPATWGYGPSDGPSAWGQMKDDWALCDSGPRQSPIDIPSSDALPGALELQYDQPFTLVVQNTGHELKVVSPRGSASTAAGEATLLQFHFHVPSEHTVGGKAAAAELHLVHTLPDQRLLVIGVLMDEGVASPALDAILEHAPADACTSKKALTGTFTALRRLLPERLSSWATYPGSLTTPGCGENVTWIVLGPRMTISTAQLARLRVGHGNARPVQPVNGRAVQWFRQ